MKIQVIYGDAEPFVVFGRKPEIVNAVYTIPQKLKGQDLPLSGIAQAVNEFLEFAKSNPEIEFVVTPMSHEVYGEQDIAPLFRKAPNNVKLPNCYSQASHL